MTAAEVREGLQVAGLVIILVLAAWGLLRPRVAVPFSGPLEEQVSQVRHRLSNVEQIVSVLPAQEIRLRSLETEMGTFRTLLTSIKEGQTRTERMLEMLVDHQLGKEKG